jgi:hypothetical protein
MILSSSALPGLHGSGAGVRTTVNPTLIVRISSLSLQRSCPSSPFPLPALPLPLTVMYVSLGQHAPSRLMRDFHPLRLAGLAVLIVVAFTVIDNTLYRRLGYQGLAWVALVVRTGLMFSCAVESRRICAGFVIMIIMILVFSHHLSHRPHHAVCLGPAPPSGETPPLFPITSDAHVTPPTRG